MVKLLSLIGSISLSTSGVTPLVEISKNLVTIEKSKSINLNIVDGNYYIFNTFPYYFVDYNTWAVAPAFITGQAANAIIKAGVSGVNPYDFELVSSYNITADRELNEDDLLGRTGSGSILVESILKPTDAGEEKGLYGEMKIYTELNYDSLDLSILNGQITPGYVSGVNEIEKISIYVHSDIFEFFLNFYEYPTFQHVNSVETSKFLFKSGTTDLFGQEDLNAMKNGEEVLLDFWLTPTVEGKERGIYNKAKMTLKYVKNDLNN
ncbi:hypothetical protein [Spiroplasma endosymbiont of Diplazon laetatorius]|uniref:hypothetical protein n=1 Tax=Spiroplasma endosymbiont of Diplazon laetatorius TaxID=3066322 RepID=UPI0030D0EFDF